MIEQELTHCGDHVCLKLEYEGVALGAQIDPAVIKARVYCRVGLDGQRIGYGFDAYVGGKDLDAAELYIIVCDSLALNGHYRVDGELIDDGVHLRAFFLFKRYLDLAADIAYDQKRHCAFVAQIFDKALYLYRAAGLHLCDIGAFHFKIPCLSVADRLAAVGRRSLDAASHSLPMNC